jgi:DeoR/GlpR family transcriptional regulator of sugar metabolism
MYAFLATCRHMQLVKLLAVRGALAQSAVHTRFARMQGVSPPTICRDLKFLQRKWQGVNFAGVRP